MNLREKASSQLAQVEDLLNGRASWIRISEYYTAKNVGGAIQLHSTAPGSVDNEFLTILLTEVDLLAAFFDLVVALRQPVNESPEEFISELKTLLPNDKPRRAIKKGDKQESAVSQ